MSEVNRQYKQEGADGECDVQAAGADLVLMRSLPRLLLMFCDARNGRVLAAWWRRPSHVTLSSATRQLRVGQK